MLLYFLFVGQGSGTILWIIRLDQCYHGYRNNAATRAIKKRELTTALNVGLISVVTPLRKAASYEPRITILGIWGDTWLTRGKYGIYVAVRGSYVTTSGNSAT